MPSLEEESQIFQQLTGELASVSVIVRSPKPEAGSNFDIAHHLRYRLLNLDVRTDLHRHTECIQTKFRRYELFRA